MQPHEPYPLGEKATFLDRTRLTRTEGRLLDALYVRPGQALTRAELAALVMPDAVVLERTIDVHVKALRRKLGPFGARIQTVRKVGYRYVAPESPDPE
jgi:two-component system phosphate regulon response regulator PhoB